MINKWVENFKKSYVDRLFEYLDKTPLGRAYSGVKRVLIVSTKPTTSQLRLVIKVSGLGAIVIGLIGLIISIISNI